MLRVLPCQINLHDAPLKNCLTIILFLGLTRDVFTTTSTSNTRPKTVQSSARSTVTSSMSSPTVQAVTAASSTTVDSTVGSPHQSSVTISKVIDKVNKLFHVQCTLYRTGENIMRSISITTFVLNLQHSPQLHFFS